jgi:hypothetical protein
MALLLFKEQGKDGGTFLPPDVKLGTGRGPEVPAWKRGTAPESVSAGDCILMPTSLKAAGQEPRIDQPMLHFALKQSIRCLYLGVNPS